MENISEARKYIDALVGTPYFWWREGMEITATAPFFKDKGLPPPATEVRAAGTNCAGFLNLICRVLDIPIPDINEPWSGGTYGWFRSLNEAGKLEPFNGSPKVGSVLIHDFEDEKEQGHVAIVIAPGIIAHSCVAYGVCIEPWINSHNGWAVGGYYSHMWQPKLAQPKETP